MSALEQEFKEFTLLLQATRMEVRGDGPELCIAPVASTQIVLHFMHQYL